MFLCMSYGIMVLRFVSYGFVVLWLNVLENMCVCGLIRKAEAKRLGSVAGCQAVADWLAETSG